MERVYAQYPLKCASEEIRLLHIFPGHWNEPVRAHFSNASLHKATPEYIALSYVWGDKSKTLPCIVDGHEFHVTSNLYSALRRVRETSQTHHAPLIIWADALCINQAVTEEKNQQVRLMGKIYSKCSYVFVWLGELPIIDDGAKQILEMDQATCASGDEYPAAKAISLKCEEILLHLAAGGHRHLTDVFPFTHDSADCHFKAIYRAFSFLSTNSWFTRRWVLQEAVMAPSVQVVFGMVSMRLNVLSRAMETIASHTEKQCCLSSRPGHYDLRHAIRGFLQNFISIQELRHLRGNRMSIIDLCLEFLDRGVSEEHDRVYSLLGMVNPPSQLVPDYRSPIHTLFAGVYADHIKRSSSLSTLHLAGLDRETAGLPSWAIDWKAIGNPTMKTWHQISVDFKAGGAIKQTPMVDSQQRLHLLGWKIDQVQAVSDILGFIWQPRDKSQDAFRQDLSFQHWRSYISAEHGWNDPYPSGDTWAMAWWRTLCADSCWGANSARRLTQRDADFFSSTLSQYTKSAGIGDGNTAKQVVSDSFELEDGRKVPADAHYNDIMGMAASLLDGMRLLYTKKGYLGVAKTPVLAGDHVFILPGCRTPMLLRASKISKEISHEDTRSFPYFLVGFCYVHGVMDGERVGEQAALEDITMI